MPNLTAQNRIKYQIDTLGCIPEEEQSGNERSNAPVTRVLWLCDNLPDGLTLSADGKLSGRPSAAGTYDCPVSVSTNWGSYQNIIRITVT